MAMNEEILEMPTEDLDRPLKELLPMLDRYSRDDPQRTVAMAREILARPSAAEDGIARARVEQLLGLAHRTLGNYKIALEHYHRAYEQFQKLGAKGDGIAVLNGIGLIYIATDEYRRALFWFQQIVDAGDLVENPITMANARLNIGVAHCNTGSYQAAIASFDEASAIFRRHGGRRGEALTALSMGSVHLYLGDYTTALDYLRAGLAIMQEIDDHQGMAMMLTNIANIYHTLDEHEEALECFQRVLGIFQNMGARRFQADLLTNIGSALERLGRFEAALAALTSATEIYDEIGTPVARARPLLTIATIHARGGAYDQAQRSLQEAIAIFEASSDRHSLVNALHASGETLYKLGRYEESRAQLERSLMLAEEIEARPAIANIRQTLAEIHEELGDPTAALAEFKIVRSIREEILKQEMVKKIESARMVTEIEKTRAEAVMYRLRNEQMEREMDLQNRHLTTLAMSLIHQNQLLRTHHDDLLRIAGSSAPDLRLPIRKAAKSLRHQAQEGEGWAVFEEGFSRLQGDFMARLSERFPSLSPTEIRICALLKINLASKDIANLLCVTGRCVETHRYNIRKKLGLRREENLITYLTTSLLPLQSPAA